MVTGSRLAAVPAKEHRLIAAGLGEIKIARAPDVLACIGLGSCIAVCAYDRLAKVGGMVHIVLPRCDSQPVDRPAKYANTAVPWLLECMAGEGCRKERLVVKLVGGAQMSLAPGLSNTFKTGDRNLDETRLALKNAGVPVAAEDVGGSKGRTVHLYLDSGRVTVRIAGGQVRDL